MLVLPLIYICIWKIVRMKTFWENILIIRFKLLVSWLHNLDLQNAKELKQHLSFTFPRTCTMTIFTNLHYLKIPHLQLCVSTTNIVEGKNYNFKIFFATTPKKLTSITQKWNYSWMRHSHVNVIAISWPLYS
jgi:hypothetical protein